MKDACLLSREGMVVTSSLGSYRLMSGRNRRVKVGAGGYLGCGDDKNMPEKSFLKKVIELEKYKPCQEIVI